MTSKHYTPELGQAIFGAPTGEYELPRYAIALFREVWREIGRIFWNREQRQFDAYGSEDPKIPNFTVRAYWSGSDDAPEAELPNFVYGEAEIRWYKYPCRGMSCNVSWTPDQWVVWFDAAMKALHEYENPALPNDQPRPTQDDEDSDESPF